METTERKHALQAETGATEGTGLAVAMHWGERYAATDCGMRSDRFRRWSARERKSGQKILTPMLMVSLVMLAVIILLATKSIRLEYP